MVCEDNLMWSARLMNGVKGAGHVGVLVDRFSEELPDGDVAIVNLGSERLRPADLVAALRAGGVFVVGHAGHKERPLLTMGRESGCDRIVTNGSLASGLGDLLGELAADLERSV